jgi:hypothetical protein
VAAGHTAFGLAGAKLETELSGNGLRTRPPRRETTCQFFLARSHAGP